MRAPAIAPIALIGLALLVGGCGGGSAEGGATPDTGTATGAPAAEPTDGGGGG